MVRTSDGCLAKADDLKRMAGLCTDAAASADYLDMVRCWGWLAQ